MEKSDVVVIGVGVIGLTIAVRLVEAGRAVVVLTDRDPQHTTSAAAGAMLGISGTPPEDAATRWTQRVNATGSGARELCGDTTITATRGVHVVVDNVGIREFRMEAVADPVWTNIFPYPSHIVLGGAALLDDGLSDDEAAAAILARAIEVEPRLATAAMRYRRDGFRPTRPTPRVELDDVAGTPCVHAYGHGGIGVTVSWGVADDVARLLECWSPSAPR